MKLTTIICLSLITLVTSLSTTARAQTFSVIYAFDGQNGAFPFAGVTLRDGTLYGTTYYRNFQEISSTVYQSKHVGSDWITTPIFIFPTDESGGALPEARVVFGPDGALYGTTATGGYGAGEGVVFSLTPPSPVCKTTSCSWKENVLHSFQDNPDGGQPGYGDLVWDSMGNIYGTTKFGGNSKQGIVYQMSKSGDVWTETPIYSFKTPRNPKQEFDGIRPFSGVILDSNGNVYGTTLEGGLYGAGTVFELTYVNGVGWTESILYNFRNLSDGQLPQAGLLRDSGGNLYGATSDGGSGGGGTLFELSPVGDTWVFTLLYSFSFTGPPGMQCGPWEPLTMDESGDLYGTTICDGINGWGNVFKLTNTQDGWEYASLYDFTDGPDGAYPVSNVTIDADGTLYGTAYAGGFFGSDECRNSSGCGTVWMIKP